MTIPREALKAVEAAMTKLRERGEPLWWHCAEWEPVALSALGLFADEFRFYYMKRPAALAEFQVGLQALYKKTAASLTEEERKAIRQANGAMSSANMDFLWDEVLS